MTGVNPADAAVVLKRLLDTWDVASQRMLAAVAARLARGITQPGWAEAKARETQALADELRAIVTRLDRATPEMVLAALDDAYEIGQRTAGFLGETHIRSRPQVVQQLAQRLVSNLQGAYMPVLRSHLDLYRSVIAEGELDLATGTVVRRDVIAQAVDRFLAKGVDKFVDAAGNHWHLDAYARMAGRTVAGQTAVQGQLDEMVGRGKDLVIISDSARECATCRPWEGRILSVTGASLGQVVDGRRVEATVAQARGAGLWHPNCRHRADPYVPGLTRKPPAKADPQGAKDEATLRRLEREARDLKRRLAVARTLGDPVKQRELRARIRAKGAQIQEHADATGQLRKRHRERPVGA